MKKLILLFLIFSSSLHAQSLYEMMSQGDLKYGSRTMDDVGISWYSSLQFCGEDTYCNLPVLRLYEKDNGRSASPETSYIPIYIDGEKIYAINFNCEKYLLYDFSVSVGDTISEGLFTDYGVDSIYNVELLDGTTRLRYDLSQNGSRRTSWIYGLGDINSGIYFYNGPFQFTSLTCIRSGDNLIFGGQDPVACEESMCFDPIPGFDLVQEDALINLTNESICLDEYQYLWDFGDETTSSDINPEHTYNEFGCYTVSLGVISDCSNDTTYRTSLVNHCSNNAWTKIGEFEFPALKFEVVNENVQFASGPYNLLKSVDNGETWIALDIPEPLLENSIRIVSDLQFYNELQGIMICRNTYIADEDQTTIFYTEDGGFTWVSSFDSYWLPYYVTLGDNGLAWTNILGVDVLKSEDFGRTWRNIQVENAFANSSRYYYLNDTLLLSTSYSFANSSCLGKSNNLGETWEFEFLDFGIRQIHFFDPMNAYLLSDYREVLKTSDGGDTWNKIDLPFEVSHFTFSSPSHGWFTSNTREIYYTTDSFASYEVTRCSTSPVFSITTVNDTLATGFIGGRISSEPLVYKYDKIEFSLSKVGTGNCDEDIISSSEEVHLEKTISLYPNPASNILNIETDLEHFDIQVYNISGQQVLQLQNQKSFNIQNLPTGTYFMTITDEQGKQIEHGKFIVQR